MHNETTHEVLSVFIVLNCIVLGVSTSNELYDKYFEFFDTFSYITMLFFLFEITLRLIACGTKFFRHGWNIFDLIIIALSVIPSIDIIIVLRGFRIFKLSKVISLSNRVQMIMESLKHAVPGIITITIILLLLFYMFAVVACNLFSETHPMFFGNLCKSMFTLFQIMIGDCFSLVVREVSTQHAYSELFFISFMIIVSFTMLNLLVALIVASMQFAAESVKPYFHSLSKKERIARLQKEIQSLERDL